MDTHAYSFYRYLIATFGCLLILKYEEITVWNAQDLGVTEDQVGLDASPTNVFRSFTPAPKGKMVQGDTDNELAKNLLMELKDKHII